MPSSIGVNLRVTGHCSQGGRAHMEDFYSVAYQKSLSDKQDLEYAFIGIYDGHGGSEASTFAKENLINCIVNQKLFWSDDDQDVLRAIEEGYIDCHYAMWREQEKWPKTASGLPSTAGTTASVAFVRHGKIYTGHVGDSGIVLGYQEDGEKCWRAKALTEDHKPESKAEQERINKSGGKVMEKSGIHRVVWNRPRIGHKGPVRRNTPIDEIPFLAVARSLGDLWSYNSALDKFVVSPHPDVNVINIDTKKFRCLIFGTDGLWNVMSAQGTVDNVYASEQWNSRNMCYYGTKEWVNPSKSLVDRALQRWNMTRMRADNTSVVIIMLDPPGPYRRNEMRSTSESSYDMEYLPNGCSNLLPPIEEQKTILPFKSFEMNTDNHFIRPGIDFESTPVPTNGSTVIARCENNVSSESDTANQVVTYQTLFDQNTPASVVTETNIEKNYQGFGEPYTFDSYGYTASHDPAYSHVEPNYRLTEMKTPHELHELAQQDNHLNSSVNEDIVVSTYDGSYHDHGYSSNNVVHDNSYTANTSVLPCTPHTAYQDMLPVESAVTDTFDDLHSSFYDNHRLMFSPTANDVTIVQNVLDSDDELVENISTDVEHVQNDEIEVDEPSNDVKMDESIQIHEISSSGDEVSTEDPKPVVSSKVQSNKPALAYTIATERKTRSSTASEKFSTRRITRNELRLHKTASTPTSTYKSLTAERKFNRKMSQQVLRKENVPTVQKDTVQMTRTRAAAAASSSSSSSINTINHTDESKRTLRTKNVVGKEVKRATSQVTTSRNSSVSVMALQQNRIKASRSPISSSSVNKSPSRLKTSSRNNNNVQRINENVIVTRPRRALH